MHAGHAYAAAISACAAGSVWPRAVELFDEMMEVNIKPDVVSCTALISALGSDAQWERAERVIVWMHQVSLACQYLLLRMGDFVLALVDVLHAGLSLHLLLHPLKSGLSHAGLRLRLRLHLLGIWSVHGLSSSRRSLKLPSPFAEWRQAKCENIHGAHHSPGQCKAVEARPEDAGGHEA